MRAAKLGLIVTGHTPRNEYVAYHRALLYHLGVDVEIRIHGALDGLSRDEIRAIEARAGARVNGCHIHELGGTRDRMGAGWTMVLIDPEALISRLQKCIDALDAEGVDAIIVCCAEEYRPDAFHSKRPLVLPWLVMLDWVHTATMYMPEPRIGVLIPGPEWMQQDTATWQSQPWMKRLKVFVEIGMHPSDKVLARLREQRVDMVLNWGYGVGIAPDDPPNIDEVIEAATGAPLISPHSLATIFARNLLCPSMQNRRFAGEHPVNPPE